MSAGIRRQRSPEPRPDWMEERGVYLARHTLRGRRVIYAVDSTGDVVKWVRLTPSQSESEVTDYLWEILETMDPLPLQYPRPKVALVRVG